MDDGADFDLQAAWLRRFQSDAESSLGAFALRLKEALPELVTVRESRGLFTRGGRITGVSVTLGEHQYALDLERGRLRATVAMVVRGITLNTKALEPGEWFARVQAATRATAAHAEALSRSLAGFMER